MNELFLYYSFSDSSFSLLLTMGREITARFLFEAGIDNKHLVPLFADFSPNHNQTEKNGNSKFTGLN